MSQFPVTNGQRGLCCLGLAPNLPFLHAEDCPERDKETVLYIEDTGQRTQWDRLAERIYPHPIDAVISTLDGYGRAAPRQGSYGKTFFIMANDLLKIRELFQWRDISSAPQDGSEVLLYFPLEGLADHHPKTIIGYWSATQKAWIWQARASRSYSDGFQPTHWMPVPQPPKSENMNG